MAPQPEDPKLAALLASVRRRCKPGLWSQGVTLARAGAVTVESRTAEEIVLRVRSPGRVVAPIAVLYPTENETECDCPVNGIVNLGGGGSMGTEGDLTKMTNMQPFIQEGGGPPPSAAADVPNAVAATAEEVANVFERGSIKVLTSRKVPFSTFHWPTVAKGAHATMPPGGRFILNIEATTQAERDLVLKAFRDAGFKDVRAGLGPPGSALQGDTELGSGAIFQGMR